MNVVTSRENGSYISYNASTSSYLTNLSSSSSSSTSSFDNEPNSNMTTNQYYYAAMNQTNISPVSSSSMRSCSPPASPSSLSSLSFASSSPSSSSILNTTQPISYNNSKVISTGYNCQTYQLNSNDRYHEHQNNSHYADNYCQLPQVSSYSQYSISDHNQATINNSMSSAQIHNNSKSNFGGVILRSNLSSYSTDMETSLGLPKTDDSKPEAMSSSKNFRIK